MVGNGRKTKKISKKKLKIGRKIDGKKIGRKIDGKKLKNIYFFIFLPFPTIFSIFWIRSFFPLFKGGKKIFEKKTKKDEFDKFLKKMLFFDFFLLKNEKTKKDEKRRFVIFG